MITDTSKKNSILTGLYPDMYTARRLVQDLRMGGVPDDQLSILSSGENYPESRYREIDGAYLDGHDTAIKDGAEAGAAAGGVGGFLLGLTTVTIPGMGPLLLVGSVLTSVVAGVSVGALTGGVIGLLVEFGLTEEEAKNFSEGLERGEVVVLARVSEEKEDAAARMFADHEPVQYRLKKASA